MPTSAVRFGLVKACIPLTAVTPQFRQALLSAEDREQEAYVRAMSPEYMQQEITGRATSRMTDLGILKLLASVIDDPVRKTVVTFNSEQLLVSSCPQIDNTLQEPDCLVLQIKPHESATDKFQIDKAAWRILSGLIGVIDPNIPKKLPGEPGTYTGPNGIRLVYQA